MYVKGHEFESKGSNSLNACHTHTPGKCINVNENQMVQVHIKGLVRL